MIIIDGRQLAEEKLSVLKEKVSKLGYRPGLAAVLVGDDPASHLYVRLKEKAAHRVGMDFHKYTLPDNADEEEVLQCIEFLREDPEVDGIIVQLPLPNGFDVNRCVGAVGADKDADGFHPDNVEKFLSGRKDVLFPVFPRALINLVLSSVGEGEEVLEGATPSSLRGAATTVLSQSELFGQVMLETCSRIGLRSRVVLCDDLECRQAEILSADVVIAACRKPQILDGKYVKTGTIVVDGGSCRINDKVVGNIDFDTVSPKAAALSPVPGGVGPVTIACLLENVYTLAQKRRS